MSKDLRARLDLEARRNQVSLNTEMTRRIEESFEATTHVAFADAAEAIRQQAEALGQQVERLDFAWARLSATRDVLTIGDLVMQEIDKLVAIENRRDDTNAEQIRERADIVKGLEWPVSRWRRLRTIAQQRLDEEFLPSRKGGS